MMKTGHVIRMLQDFSIPNPMNAQSQTAIARSLLDYIFANSIEGCNLEDLANYCHTSIATFSRFIKELGFSNFKAFKQAILLYQKESTMIHSQVKKSPLTYSQLIADCIIETATLIDQDEITYLAKRICVTENVYLFGIHYSEMILKELQYNLLKLGKQVYWAEGSMKQLQVLDQVAEDSLCIFVSFTGSYTQSIIPALLQKKVGFSPVLITSQADERLQAIFEQTFSLTTTIVPEAKTYQVQFFFDLLFNEIKNELIKQRKN